MNTCEHNSSTVQADHGNVKLSECDWGCGAILISVEQDGVTRMMTADEAWQLKAENAKLRGRLREIYNGIYMGYYSTLVCDFTDEEFEQLSALLREASE